MATRKIEITDEQYSILQEVFNDGLSEVRDRKISSVLRQIIEPSEEQKMKKIADENAYEVMVKRYQDSLKNPKPNQILESNKLLENKEYKLIWVDTRKNTPFANKTKETTVKCYRIFENLYIGDDKFSVLTTNSNVFLQLEIFEKVA
jgi:hypothetical protein